MSIIRYFCISIAIIFGLSVAVLAVKKTYDYIEGPQYLPGAAEPLIMQDADGNIELLPTTAPAILRIDFHGILGLDDLTREKIAGLLRDSRNGFLYNRIKGILLHLDTPGGAADDAEGIYDLLMEYKKKYNVPIYAYVDGICASGGMFIAASADKIYATYSSIVGSIGVLWDTEFNYSDVMAKIGIASTTITKGKYKDAYNPFRPWGPDENISIRPIIESLYKRFVSVISQARPKLTENLLINEYGARVFISTEGEELGYIDVADSNYAQALNGLIEEAGIKESYQVVQLITYHTWMDRLKDTFAPKTLTEFMGFTAPHISELKEKPLFLYRP